MSNYQLHLGDCLEFMRGMEAKSIDTFIIDPPYGTENLAGGYGRRQLWSETKTTGRMIQNDKDLTLLELSLPLAVKVLMDDAWCAAFCAARKMPEVLSIFDDNGLKYFGEIIWNKKRMGLGYSIRYQHESILVFKKGDPKKSDDAISSVIECFLDMENLELHPHVKPVPVMSLLVNWLCPVGGTVLDFVCGIGTTGVACMQSGRKFIGCEIKEQYFNIAQRRIAQAALQEPLFV